MKHYLIIIAMVMAAAGCQKEVSDELPPTPSPLPVHDRQTVLIKEINDNGLPAPYFHFTYDDSAYVTQIRFADGLSTYQYQYSGQRISNATLASTGETLAYRYNNNLVEMIENRNADGDPVWKYLLQYTGNKLSTVRYFRIKSGIDSLEERRVTFSYDASGNLSTFKDYWRGNNGELALSRTFIYSEYDNRINVDGFYLYKNFFEHLLFLPGVKLQVNNPGKLRILGADNDYEVNYTYTYQNNLPIAKTGNMVQTRGSNPSPPVLLQSTYTYY